MTKPKTLDQLQAEKEQAETQLAEEQHKLERLENRKKYLEKGERTKRTHRLCIEISYISHALIFNYLLRPNEHKKRVSV